MNNEQDKILDDLINYYDSADDDILSGDTTVIPPVKPPAEETLGDTLVMNVKPSSRTTETTAEDCDKTITVNIPDAEPPADEVFGNMDIDGNIIPQRPRQQVRQVPEISRPEPTPVRRAAETVQARKTGLWYSLKPLWATVIVCAALVFSYWFYITDSGIIGIYKSNFSYNLSLIMRAFGVDYDPSNAMPIIGGISFSGTTVYAEGEETAATVLYEDITKKANAVPFAEADTANFEKYDKGVVCAKSNYLCYITQNGDKKWEQQTQISNPILSVGGKYIAVAGSGSTHLNLYKGKDLVFSIDVPNKIKACSVSEKGDVALITDKEAYKGSVSVINKKGEEVFSWISGVNYITSVAMLKSRNVAVSLVSAENTVKSYVMLFDIYDSDPINGTEIANSLIFNSDKHKNNAYICADNSIASVNKDGELNYCIRFDDMEITHTASDEKGRRAISYTADNIPYINVYNRKGELYATAETESVPDYIDIYKSTILYNNGRDVLCGEADDIKTRYAAPMTVKNLIMINKNAYMIVYENSLEIVKL